MNVDKLVVAAETGDIQKISKCLEKTWLGPSIDINGLHSTSGHTALIIATNNGHKDAVQFLINRGAAVNVVNKFGSTALMEATITGDLSMVELLLRSGADYRLQNKGGWSVLHFASLQNHTSLVELFLRKGASHAVINENWDTPLHIACANGSTASVDLLIRHRASHSTCRNKFGGTPFMSACFFGHVQIVELLLRNGADLTVQDNNGDTALHLAYVRSNLPVAALLEQYGANRTCRNKKGQTPLDIHVQTQALAQAQAHRQPQPQVLVPVPISVVAGASVPVPPSASPRVAPNSPTLIPIVTATAVGMQPGIPVPQPVIQGVDAFGGTRGSGRMQPVVQAPDTSGARGSGRMQPVGPVPVDLGARVSGRMQPVGQGDDVSGGRLSGRYEAATSMLSGAVGLPEEQRTSGRFPPPSPFLSELSPSDTAIRIVSDKPYSNLPSSERMYVDELVEAASASNIEAITRLLDRGVPVDGFHSTTARTALMAASHLGYEPVVRLLLPRGAKINLADNLGETALMFACKAGHLSIAKLLLRNGADHTLHSNDGNTALHFTCSQGHVLLAESLLRQGASHSHRNEAGQIPVERCNDNGKRVRIQAIIDSLCSPPLDPSDMVDPVIAKSGSQELDSLPSPKSPVILPKSLEDVSVDLLGRLLESWNLQELASGFQSQGIDGATLSLMNTSTPEQLAKELNDEWNITISKTAQVKLFHKKLVSAFPDTFKESAVPSSDGSPIPLNMIPSSRFMCNGAAVNITESISNRISFGCFLNSKNQSTSCVVKHVNFSSSHDMSAVYLLREIGLLRTLNNLQCSAVVELYDSHNDTEQHQRQEVYFVMEDAGASLGSMLVDDCPRQTCEALTVKLVQCMETLHAAGVMHGDIKPQHILFRYTTHDFEVKFCGFDSAAHVDRNELCRYEGDKFKCAAEYTGPEFLSAAPGHLKASFRIDYFALGLVIWQLLNTTSQPLLGDLCEAELRNCFSSEQEWERRFLRLRYATSMAPFIVKLCKLNAADRVVDHTVLHHSLHQQRDSASTKMSIPHDALLSLGEKIDGFTDTIEEIVSTYIGPCLQGSNEATSKLELMRVLIDQLNSQLAAAITSNQYHQAREILLQLQVSIGASFAPIGAGGSSVENAFCTILGTKLNELLDCLHINNSHAKDSSAFLFQSMQKLESDLTQTQEDIRDIKVVVQEFGSQLCSIVSQNAYADLVLDHLDDDEYLLSDAVVQQRQLLQSQLVKVQSAIDVLPDTEMMQAIRQQLKDQCTAEAAKLHKLLTDCRSIPTLLLILPDIPSGVTHFDPARLVDDSFRLYFLCAHTLRVMACGPEGKGYPLKVSKAWLNQVTPLLKVSLVLLKAGLTVTGLPLPVAGLANLLLRDEQASQNILQFAFDLLSSTTAADAQVNFNDVNSLDLSKEGSRDAYAAIKQVMDREDPTMKYSGLTFVTASQTGKCQWIANDPEVVSSFHMSHGERCAMQANAVDRSNDHGKKKGRIMGKWLAKN